MGKGIYSAVSGAVGSLRQLDVLANNLANLSTAGYKGQRIAFSEVLGRRMAASPPQDASFVAVAATRADLQAGPLARTDSPLDVALEGPGYLVVQRGTERAFVRSGSLAIDTGGRLVAPSGHPLLDVKNRPIETRSNSPITLGRDGSVLQDGKSIARLQLVEFAQPQKLERVADTLYKAPASEPAQVARSTALRAGYIERANVNAVRAVTSMVTASRAYEAFHRLISTFREVDSAAARISTER